MTDQEMIELAAQAAGVDGKIIPGFIGIGIGTERDGWIFWNPLKYNGDALELAVKLEISLEFAAKATWVKLRDEDGTLTLGNIPHNNDPYAATRRAIVLAAAEKYQEQQEKNNGN